LNFEKQESGPLLLNQTYSGNKGISFFDIKS